MNDRNAEALAVAIFLASDNALSPGEARTIANGIISSHGVLVPRALTDEELDRIGTDETTGEVLALLERIAKGEP